MTTTNMKDFKKYIKFLLNDAVQKREKARGTGAIGIKDGNNE